MSLRDKIVDAVVAKAAKDSPLFLEERPIPGHIPTGSLEIDALIGAPGIPLGRISHIKGWSGSGKSMICSCLMAQVQKMGGLAVLLDTERSYTKPWAESLGVNTSEVFDISKNLEVDSLESAFSAIHVIMDAIDEKDEEPVLFIVDSLSALSPDSEMEADYDDQQPGRHARISSKAMRKLTIETFAKKVALVFVSQLREKIMSFGASTATIGGHAIFFHAALELDMKRERVIKEGNSPIGFETKIVVTKNKLGGVPFIDRTVKLFFENGINIPMSALNPAIDVGLVEYNKGWYSLVEGGKKFRESEWPDVMTPELFDKIKDRIFSDRRGV
jgi:recombination protein RecA